MWLAQKLINRLRTKQNIFFCFTTIFASFLHFRFTDFLLVFTFLLWGTAKLGALGNEHLIPEEPKSQLKFTPVECGFWWRTEQSTSFSHFLTFQLWESKFNSKNSENFEFKISEGCLLINELTNKPHKFKILIIGNKMLNSRNLYRSRYKKCLIIN